MSSLQDARPKRSAAQRVTSIRRWTDTLWTLRIERPDGFRFQPGHYAKLGLPVDDADAVWRPYSIVSAPEDGELEFLFILIPDGALSSHMARLREGDRVMIELAAFGFFVETQLAPGDTLWMMATGTGLGPYVSLLRTPGALERYRDLVVVHSVREAAELAYADELRAHVAASGAAGQGRLRYVPIVTREPGATELSGRIPQLLADGSLPRHAGATFDPASARVMVCGNPAFSKEMRQLLTERGFVPCRRSAAGSMLFENYW
jgi:ferredoxin/flavodoxin---NADP+ reductase